MTKRNKKPRITTIQELRLYRQKLETEVVRTEVAIESEFRAITGSLTPMNVAKTVGRRLSALKIVSSALAIGKALIARKKKKKKKQDNQPDTDETGS